ncbi:uncharacterized protein N7503_002980 [Penicillium pulvis]|uniref:uncharacterized protein n=1 Tax=Penicillium pulvis TaxID=1562058 RepID=UPI0025479AE5|nr:uncharacterized protein N7503_002980 [Penicillium pulvis]KAJ5805378.1 hypothetical protein N7503_002980 [Penicillium pulvis]
MSAGDDMLMPWDLDSKWTRIPGVDGTRKHSEIGRNPDEPMGWEHTDELLQLPPLSGTDLTFLTNPLLLNANQYDLPAPDEFTLSFTSIASQQRAYVSYLLESMAQLDSLILDPCELGRFDRIMQVINNVWATIRAILQCDGSKPPSQLFSSMLSCIRLACGWFQSRASSKQREASVSCSPPSVNGIDIRYGEYKIPHTQVHVMHGLLIHMAVQDGIDLLRGIRCMLEKEALTLGIQASVASLTPVDVNYFVSVLGHCEEEMMRILHVGRDLLTMDSTLPDVAGIEGEDFMFE